jgi:type IV secretion system protein VirB1
LEEKTMKLGILACISLVLALRTSAQQAPAGSRLSEAEFVSLAGRCAPGAPPDTLLAIARTESSLYANAISINRPRASARRAGYGDGEIALSKQPGNRIEAKQWLRWLALHHFTVSIGLMQVNAETALQFHVAPDQLLEPCTNLRIGAAILISLYTDFALEIGEGFSALDAALSFYNTGNATAGFRNGYVANVYAHAPRRSPLF